MTASTPPLVDVIAGAVVKALELDIGGEREDQAFWYNTAPSEWPAVIARAVLDALTKAGGVEWGVFRRGGDQRDLPLDNRTFTTEAAARKWVGRIYNDLSWLEIRSRHTAPWTVVE